MRERGADRQHGRFSLKIRRRHRGQAHVGTAHEHARVSEERCSLTLPLSWLSTRFKKQNGERKYRPRGSLERALRNGSHGGSRSMSEGSLRQER